MDIKDTLQDGLSKGVDASKKLYKAAKEKVKDMTELGVATIELNQLEDKLKDKYAELGKIIVDIVTADPAVSLQKDDPRISRGIADAVALKASVAKKQEEIKNIKKK